MPVVRATCLLPLVLLGPAARPGPAQTATPPPCPVQIKESIDVHAADAPPTEVPGLRSTVSGSTAAAVPLNGRSFIPLLVLAPGVALPQGSALPRINGGRPRTNEYIYDGISVLQPEPGQVPFLPVIDAIDTLTIARNSPPAEFGRFNGGVVTIVTRAGGGTFHGSLFEFGRHEALNARNLFAPPETHEDPGRPRFRRQQFGGTAGGPLRADRLFFFADYQGTAQSIGRVAISTVPTLLQRRGIFTEPVGGRQSPVYDPATLTQLPGGAFTRTAFPGNVIPASRIDPIALALLQHYPQPTSAGTANNYRRVADEDDAQRQIDGRVDYRVSDRTRAFARVSMFGDDFTPAAPLPDGSGTITAGAAGPQQTDALAIASNYQRTLGSRSFNELRAGYTRRAVRRQGLDMATFVIDGYQQLGSPPNTTSSFRTDVTQIVDALTWMRGRHTWKAGFDFRWQRLDIVQPPSPNGTYRFSSLFTDLPGTSGTGSPFASFLLGQVQSFSIDLQPKAIRPRAHSEEFFLQDAWNPTNRLTIDAGVRYTLNFPSTEADNQAAVFNLRTERLDFLGRGGHPRAARELHKLNFGPRLGVTWRPGDRTVLRGGYALVWIEQTGITTPFTTPQFPFLQTITSRTLDGVTPALSLSDGPTVTPIPLTPDAGLGQGVFAVDRSLGSGSAQQWHVAVRRQLGSHWSVELAYAGSTITHVGIPDSNLNQLSVDELATGPALLQRVPNPFFGQIPRSSSIGDPTIPVAQLLKPYPRFTTVSLYRHNVGTTEYHAAEVTLEHRLAHGLSALVAYTRSRLVDDASSVFDASILTGPVANFPVADSFNRSLERDLSTGDMPHVLVASVVWAVRGWSISPILTLQSGVPLAVTQATNFNAFAGFGTQRPNRSHDPALPPDRRSLAQWFDTSAFTLAPQFTIGNSSRNPVRGPAYRSLDVAVARRMMLRSRTTIELRGEVFNVTNTPPLAPPNGVLGTPGFGSITSAGDPRVCQLAVKFLF
jgi:TonB dependent receptor